MRKIIAGIFALLSINGAAALPDHPAFSEKINYRGGLVVFALPSAWIEEYEPEGGGVLYAPGENTGTLRLDVIN